MSESSSQDVSPGQDVPDGTPLVEVRDELTFHYIKTGNFRPIQVDGVFGGPTARGLIAMHLFSERPPLPQQITHEIKPDATLGDEIQEKRVSREGVIRDVESCLLMSLETAESISRWLQKNASEFRRLKGKVEELRASAGGSAT